MDGNRPTYPNLAGKHAHDAFVTPSEKIAYIRSLGLLDDFEPPAGIVVCYQPLLLEHCMRTEGVDAREPAFRGLITLPSTEHRVGVLAGFGYGAPVTALLLEEFIELGTANFISIGTAGSLQHSCTTGHIVLCQRAIRDEGVSHHYLPPGKYADASPELTEALARELDARGIGYTAGCS